ncbi:MAG: NAAT family transporter [Alphaproteobacteria bacterium]|nr:NAAT family transporter [Alphaproteobacteria bacterium]
MLEVFLTALVTFFVVIDPPGVTPMFATLTQDMPPAWRTLMAWKSVAIAAAILLGFAFGGEWVLGKLHVSLDSFRIAGGLLLFLIALDMLFETRSQRRQARNARVIEERRAHPGEHEDISVFPLAIPLIAGPGSIASIMLLFAQHADWAARGAILAGVAANLAVTLIVFLIAARVSQLMSATLAAIVTKVFGILLAALASQFVVDGVKGAFGLT